MYTNRLGNCQGNIVGNTGKTAVLTGFCWIEPSVLHGNHACLKFLMTPLIINETKYKKAWIQNKNSNLRITFTLLLLLTLPCSSLRAEKLPVSWSTSSLKLAAATNKCATLRQHGRLPTWSNHVFGWSASFGLLSSPTWRSWNFPWKRTIRFVFETLRLHIEF